jgi:hypothetical protein
MLVVLGLVKSRLGHEKPWLKIGGPSSKAKYTYRPIEKSTVRERRKEPREGSEIDTETACVQAVGAWFRLCDCVPFV